MGEWRDFPLPDGAYADETRPWTQQDVCNYLPTFAEGEGTRSRLKLATAPGLRLHAVVGDGPHRGARDVEGKRFVVSGNKLYQLASTGVATELGTIPGTRRVSMTHNQVAGGNQLVIATGDNSYVWDTVEETLTATGIPLLFVDFINQLIVGVDVARRFWRYSALADATGWNSLDNESAESSPDRIVGLIVSQGEVLIFGERTIEVWSNSPTDTTAFQRSTVIEKGCANGNTICRLDNTVFFVGNDLIPYRLNGYAPMPIASKAITAQLSQGDPSKLFAFTWEDRGYVVYYLTAQDGHTWGHDVTSGRWHRRESFGLDRWRLNTLFKWNGSWWGGDYSSGKLYQMEWGLVYEHDTIFPRSVRSGVMHNEGNRVFIHALRLFADTGAESPNTEPSALTADGDVPGGFVGDAKSGSYTAEGGVPPYSFAVTSGTLVAGLTLQSDGSYSGTLTTAGDYSWTVTATDALGDTAAVPDTASVTEPPAGVWLVVGARDGSHGSFSVTEDVTNWTDIADVAGATNAYSATTNGNSLLITTAVSEATYTADRGSTWTPCTGLGTYTLTGPQYFGGKWFIFTNSLGNYYVSSNGVDFSPAQVSAVSDQFCLASATNGTLLVTAGYKSAVTSDGESWSVSGTYVFGASNNARSMATDGTKFIAACTNNKLFSTTDGLAWTEITSPFAGTANLAVIAHDPVAGRWLVFNASGLGYYSDTGEAGSWTATTFTLASAPYGLAGHDGEWVLTNGASIYSSVDGGDNFTARTDGFVTAARGVAFWGAS